MSKDEPEIRVLKKATCKTLSGKSTITYEVCALPDSSIHLRVTENTGGGFFSEELIAVRDVLDVLGEVPEGRAVTSWLMQPLFKGKSVNTPAFLIAALTNEKLLRVLKGKKRGHQIVDPEDFTARMEKLVSSSVKPKAKKKTAGTTQKTTTKKAAIKKKVASRRKKASTV